MTVKPEHIFDREREWAGLETFARNAYPGAMLGVVSGRRRQGKSFLLEALASATGGLYFPAVEATEAVSLLAPPEPGRSRRLLSLGEVKWGQVMTPQHAARLARARDLLGASFDISDCALACYSAAGFSEELRSAAGPGLILVSSGDLYQ